MNIDIGGVYDILLKIIIKSKNTMKSTRQKVLQTLTTNPGSTIVDIAEAVGINAISVRHHLTSLQADGLVNAEEERHGVGRPRLVYFLTEKGQEKFPKRYYHLTTNLLQQMKKYLSEKQYRSVFVNMANDISDEFEINLKPLSFEERLDFLVKVMESEGFQFSWTKKDGNYHIDEISCPYYQIGKEHPEVCLFDRSLISNILSIPIEEIQHKKKSNNHCVFIIKE